MTATVPEPRKLYVVIHPGSTPAKRLCNPLAIGLVLLSNQPSLPSATFEQGFSKTSQSFTFF